MSWMLLPMVACAIIVLTLGWFGLHVLEREVIFVDLALAQVAALGTTWAVFLGHDPDSMPAFAIGLLFTAIGSAAFSATRIFADRVPQEAIIGITYAVSAAAGILLIHFAEDPHGAEKLEHLLVGNIVWVQPADVGILAGACGAVGLFHAVFRRQFLAVSYRREEVARVGLWDLAFYGSFGLALTAIVAVSGVLLVFSYLVIPAVIARLTVNGVVARLLVAWAVGLLVSVVGVGVSYEHPTGPVIVTLFGGLLLVVLVVHAVRVARARARAAAEVLAAGGVVAAALAGSSALPPAVHEEHGMEERAPAAVPEADEFARLGEAVTRLRAGDRGGLESLVALTSAGAPFIRMEADSRLRALAGSSAPAFDPLAGGASPWPAWLAGIADLPAGWQDVPLP